MTRMSSKITKLFPLSERYILPPQGFWTTIGHTDQWYRSQHFHMVAGFKVIA